MIVFSLSQFGCRNYRHVLHETLKDHTLYIPGKPSVSKAIIPIPRGFLLSSIYPYLKKTVGLVAQISFLGHGCC